MKSERKLTKKTFILIFVLIASSSYSYPTLVNLQGISNTNVLLSIIKMGNGRIEQSAYKTVIGIMI